MSEHIPTTTPTAIGIYQINFLSVSMTFVYRQLLGVRDEYLPVVLATRRDNERLFPYSDLYVRGRGIVERVYSRMLRETSAGIATMSFVRRRFWRKVLADRNVKMVHAHFGPAGIDVLPVVKSMGMPLLVTFHGYDASSALKNPAYVEKLQELFAYADIVAISQCMAERLIAVGADPRRLRVHYIGAPLEDFAFVQRKPIKEKIRDGDTVIFLQVANFVEKKGHRYSLEAFRKFLRIYRHCKLILAGDGPLRPSIEEQCRELDLVEKVHFVGAVAKSEVIDLMSKADVFLHHSVTAENGEQEGIPTVLMEAMATGLVVVSTHHSGIPELIEDGVNGFLVPERDIDAYTQKLEWAVAHPGGIPEKAASRIRSKFNMATQNESLKQIYRDILASARTGSFVSC